jgi:hypothetical protein
MIRLAKIATLAAMVHSYVGWVLPAGQPKAGCARVEFRIYEDRPGAGLRPMAMPGTRRTVYLHADAFMSGEDVAEVGAFEGRDLFTNKLSRHVEVTLTKLGVQRLATVLNRDHPLTVAILVDGEILFDALVSEAHETMGFFDDSMTREAADRMVRRLNGRCR